MLDERRLHRMQRCCRRQAFDGGDPAALRLKGEHEAGVDAAAVDVHRARAALPVIAAFLGSHESHAFAKRIEKAYTRLYVDLYLTAIDLAADGLLPWRGPCARCAWRRFRGASQTRRDGQRNRKREGGDQELAATYLPR